MEKKFKCQSCNKEFVADTNNYITCPNCGSDNVAIVEKKFPVKIIAIVAAAVIAVTAISVILFKQCGKEDTTIEVTDPGTGVTDGKTDGTDGNTGGKEDEEKKDEGTVEILKGQPTWADQGTPKYDKNTDSYSLSSKAKFPEGTVGQYALKNLSGKVIAESANGAFTGIPPVTGGTYKLVARSLKNNVCVDSLETNIPGFDIVPKKADIQKMSVAEIQSLIDRKDTKQLSPDKNPRIAPSVAVVCRGDLGEGNTAPTTLDQIANNIPYVWTGVEVESVGYDDLNRVNKVVIKPIL